MNNNDNISNNKEPMKRDKNKRKRKNPKLLLA
jgi:hypothetical protein